MVTSKKGVTVEAPDKMSQENPPSTGFHDSVSSKTDCPDHALPKIVLGEVQRRQNTNSELPVEQFTKDEGKVILKAKVDYVSSDYQSPQSSKSTIPKESDINQITSLERSLKPNTESSPHSGIADEELATKEIESPNNGDNSSGHNQEGTLSTIQKRASYSLQPTQGHDSGVPVSENDQEKAALILRPEKVLEKLPLRRNPENVAHAVLHSESKLPEKPSVDGYNWRKYGQKLVRGNAYIRSYYKCTFSNCPARKQVERSHDGHITEINYLWNHEHPITQLSPVKSTGFATPIQARRSDDPSIATSEDVSSVEGSTSHHTEVAETPLLLTYTASPVPLSVANAASPVPLPVTNAATPAPLLLTHAASDDYDESPLPQSSEIKSEVNDYDMPVAKKQKRDVSAVKDTVVTKMNCEPRLVVQTTSEVDIVNDGYRWRKYGQKLVKGNPNPRSYYRCSSAGCPVKKHVERSSHDAKVVITTYEGRHDHDMPSGRTVSLNTSVNSSSTTTIDGDELRREQENKEIVLHVGAA